MLIKLTLSYVFVNWYVHFHWHVSRFACVKFQTNLTCFCWIIAIYLGVHFFSGHSVHNVLGWDNYLVLDLHRSRPIWQHERLNQQDTVKSRGKLELELRFRKKTTVFQIPYREATVQLVGVPKNSPSIKSRYCTETSPFLCRALFCSCSFLFRAVSAAENGLIFIYDPSATPDFTTKPRLLNNASFDTPCWL